MYKDYHVNDYKYKEKWTVYQKHRTMKEIWKRNKNIVCNLSGVSKWKRKYESIRKWNSNKRQF